MSFDVAISKLLGEVEIAVTMSGGQGATVLFGPSGRGKTSILNMVAGLMAPDTGYVRICDETLFDREAGIDVPPERRHAGYVFQEPRLFPHLKVRANLLYGTRADGGNLEEAIGFLGIAHLLDRWPNTLSGGEARRVAIGRALLSNPRFLLLDEPLSSLDRARREEVLRAIEHVRDVRKLPILMVTHDMEEAERIGTSIVAI